MTDTQDQLIVLPGAESADASANNAATSAAAERAKRRSGSLTSMLLPELQALASSMGIATTKMRKSDLVAAIQSAQRPGGAAAQAAPAAAPSAIDSAPAATQAPPAPRARRSASRAVTTIEPTAGRPDADAAPAADGAPPADQPATTGDRAERSRSRDGGRYRDQSRDGQNGQVRDGQARDNRDGQARDGQQVNGRDGQARDNRDGQARDGQQVNGRDGQARDNRDGQARDNRDGQNRDGQQVNGRDGQARDNRDGQNRDGNRDFNNRNANRTDRTDRNQSSTVNDEDDEYGQGRRPRRYRDRRGRTRDRVETGGGRNDIEPTISEDDVLIPVAGIVDNVDDKGSWFIRVNGYFASSDDVYVSNSHVRRYNLRRGDAVTGAVRQTREGERKEKFNPLVRLDTINGVDPERARGRVEFTKLTPLYPQERLRLETESHILTTRVIDLVMPIGKGQRALIVSPPKAGKTMIMQAIANAIATNNPECHLMVVLIDERPEEVTDMQRTVKGEVVSSTFDEPATRHVQVSE
ncbi:MAG: Rho termination factor N-terminal domain-containing protein, partial [Actinobacteria bacterium]|nr:Rho termination factor N-terminal domain-containing protein [Actinomycetota bacterium]